MREGASYSLFGIVFVASANVPTIGGHHGIRNSRQYGSPGFETLLRDYDIRGRQRYERQCKTRPQWRRVSGALRRSKSSPPPELGFVSSCHGGMVHGTPEGCTRWRFMDVFGERYAWRARVSGRWPGSLVSREIQYGRCCSMRCRQATSDSSRLSGPSWVRGLA